jgi:hypothetical protein
LGWAVAAVGEYTVDPEVVEVDVGEHPLAVLD